MPFGLGDLADLLTHPAVMPIWQQMVMPQPRIEDRFNRMEEHLSRIEAQYGPPAPTRRSPAPQAGDVEASGLALEEWSDHAEVAARNADEAWRFARDDGVDHPQAETRLRVVQAEGEWLANLERFDLSPARLASMTPDDRRVAEALLPQVRSARQAILNGTGTAEGVRQAAAESARLHTMLRAARMGQAMAAPAPAAAGASGSRYLTSEGARSIKDGCIPCARAHFATTAGTLGVAAANPDAPDAPERIATATREIGALLEHDWTDAKIAASPTEERVVLERYRPQVEALHRRLQAATTPDDVRAASAQAAEVWQGFRADTQGMAGYGRPVAAMVDRDALMDPELRGLFYQDPTRAEMAAEAAPTDYGVLMERLQRRAEAGGVRFQVVPDATLCGGSDPRQCAQAMYLPATRTIDQTAAVTHPQNLSLQTRMHEVAHDVLDRPECCPECVEPTQQVVERSEAEVDLATLAAMDLLGLPIHYADGHVDPPGAYTLDWARLQERFGAATAARVRYAADWLVAAAQDGPAPGGGCPVAAPARVAGTTQPFGYGFARPVARVLRPVTRWERVA